MQRLTAFVAVAALGGVAAADSTSGVDVALYRSSYDTNGVFTLEGARLMPKRDLSFKFITGYAASPLDVAVPGIGGMPGNTGEESVLDYVLTLDMTFGMSITEKLAVGLDVGAYRTSTGTGYGVRGRYAGGMVSVPSTGLVSLRPLSNVDQSASSSDDAAYLGDGLAGPLDVRVGAKYSLFEDPNMALTAVGTVALPFGDDQMLLGDRNLVYEPKVAFEWRPDRVHATKVIGNLGARIRNRTVLEAYDTADSTATVDDAKVFLDVGSELLVGAGGTYEITPRAIAAAEVTLFAPLPETIGYGRCRSYNGRACKSLDGDDYWSGAKEGDLTLLATIGAFLRVSADVTATVTIGTGQVGARGDDFRVTTGLVWSPQPAGVAAPGRNDHDGDRIPDSVDACPDEAEDLDDFQDEDGCADADNDADGIDDDQDDCVLEPEDKDGFKDGDGCPERDNESDGIPDVSDKCPNDSEDVDGFEDDDGCPDEDNDGDGLKDAADKCPNDAETVNSFEDDDGCPDVRATSGPEERLDRIDFKGQPLTFDKKNQLTAAAKVLLTQAATIIKNRKLNIRIEVHVALGTRATGAAAIRAQKQRDKQSSTTRARAIFDFLVSVGVPPGQLQAVGIGSDRPLGTLGPTDPQNDRVDLIKSQQGGTP
jgi:outer membrane protein OmpA-like peptidoglycan-associated protein